MTENSRDDLDILDLDDLLDNDEDQTEAPAAPDTQAASGKSSDDTSDASDSQAEDIMEENGFEYESLDLSSYDKEENGLEEEDAEEEEAEDAESDFYEDLHRPQHERDAEEGRSSRRPAPAASKRRRHGFWIHVVLLIAIAAVAVVAVVRLLIWNQGIDIRSLGIDPEANRNRYNVEVNDSMIYLTDDQLAGHEDDGVTTILCLGDDPFSLDRTETGLAGQIAALGGENVSVINAAFPDSQVTCENTTYQTDSIEDMDDIFNLFYVSYAISIGDFSSLETVASVHNDNTAYSEAVQALESTDFSKVDMIAIMYDASDYTNGAAMQNPDNPDELTTYVGSLSNSFKLLQQQYPYIRIVFLSPYYEESDGESGRTTDYGNGTITNYFQWAYDTCSASNVSFLDNYYGSVNENNYQQYTSDGIHLNSDGCTKIADHFVWKVLDNNYDEYNVEEMAVAK